MWVSGLVTLRERSQEALFSCEKANWGEEIAHYNIISCIISMQPYRLKNRKDDYTIKGFSSF